jgi:hypothetical protein
MFRDGTPSNTLQLVSLVNRNPPTPHVNIFTTGVMWLNSLITWFSAIAAALQSAMPSIRNPFDVTSHSRVPADNPHDSSIVCKRSACLLHSPVLPTPSIDTPADRGRHS